ncbi:glycosyltransferase [Alkalicoccus chagannorensis]|uniref:glycosyltransferase n=1 Tax=Alkalicoccus chagannorensis TaxID=427072 RepID=UPI0003FED89A|nr:glycosyltransferase family 2 protein [Alkalicoccus chagannorensis]
MTGVVVFYVLLLVWTLVNTLFFPKLRTPARNEGELLSILIPMRNEERNVDGVMTALQELTWDPVEIIVLDDGSEDLTKEKLKQWQKQLPLRIIDGKPLPEGWVGKVHACHQLAQEASGTFFWFLDADMRPEQHTPGRLLHVMSAETGLVTGFPYVPASSLLGYLLTPMQHFLVYFHLPGLLANYTKWAPASAAHGASMFFRKNAYIDSGGHEAVRHSLVEDIHLARQMKKSGWYTALVRPGRYLTCWMYEGNREVWSGFAKNFFPGIGRSYTAAVLLILFYLIVFTLPAFAALYGAATAQMLFVLPYFITVVIKMRIDAVSGQPLLPAFAVPLAAAVMSAMLMYSMSLAWRKQGFSWKGRRYQ